MADGRIEFAAIKFCNSDIVVVVGRSQYGSPFFLYLLLASVKKHVRAFLDFRLLWILRDQSLETTNGFFEFLGMQRLETRFVGLNGILEVLRAGSFGRRCP